MGEIMVEMMWMCVKHIKIHFSKNGKERNWRPKSGKFMKRTHATHQPAKQFRNWLGKQWGFRRPAKSRKMKSEFNRKTNKQNRWNGMNEEEKWLPHKSCTQNAHQINKQLESVGKTKFPNTSSVDDPIQCARARAHVNLICRRKKFSNKFNTISFGERNLRVNLDDDFTPSLSVSSPGHSRAETTQ